MNVKEKFEKQELNFDKRAIPVLIVFVLLVTIGLVMYFYWRSRRSVHEEESKSIIAATIFPIFDITRSIVGESESFEVDYVIPNDTIPEEFEPTLEARERLLSSDVVFKIGVGFDDWLDDITFDSEVEVVDLSEVVELIETEEQMTPADVCEENGGSWLAEYDECESLNQKVCEENGGTFNSCASACRHREDNIGCIQVCVAVCKFSEVETTLGNDNICEDNNGEWFEAFSECEGLAQEVCEENNGEYFPCESACRHDPETDYCIEVCVEVCKFDQEHIQTDSSSMKTDMYYWLSIENAKKIAGAVYNELISLKPELSVALYENYTQYLQSLDEAKSYIESKITLVEDKRLITFSEAFNYFADEYDLDIVATFDPDDLADPTDEFKDEFARTLEEYEISIVYVEPDVSEEEIENLFPEISLEVRTLDSLGGNEPILTYIDLMRFNGESVSGN